MVYDVTSKQHSSTEGEAGSGKQEDLRPRAISFSAHWTEDCESIVSEFPGLPIMYPDMTSLWIHGNIRIVPSDEKNREGLFAVRLEREGEVDVVGYGVNVGQAQAIAENPWTWLGVYDRGLILSGRAIRIDADTYDIGPVDNVNSDEE